MQSGGINPFQLGNKNQKSQPFGIRPSNESEMQSSQNQPFGFRITAPMTPSSQPTFGGTPGGFHGFGSPAAFSTPMSTVASSSTFTGKQIQSSSIQPVFGSAFQSQTMSSLSGHSDNSKSRPTFGFTGSSENQPGTSLFSNQVAFGGQQQQPSRLISTSAFTSVTVPSSSPRLGGSFLQSSLSNISSKPKNDGEFPQPSTAPSTTSLFGQKFGTVPSTNIFGGVSKDPLIQGGRYSPAPPIVSSTTEGVPKQDASQFTTKRESPLNQRGALPPNTGKQLKSNTLEREQGSNEKTFVKQKDMSYKPLIQRKNVLFARAMAGVGRTDRPRVRLPSKDDRQSDPRIKKASERRGSISVDPGETTRLSSHEIEQLTSIICKGLPDHLNNKPTLLEHFGKFGIVVKVYCNLPKKAATIHYQNHTAAAAAKARGSVIKSGEEPVLILWSKVTPAVRPKSKAESHKSVSKETVASAKPYIQDAQVNDELQSMRQCDMMEVPKILPRPKEVSARPVNTKLASLDTGEVVQDIFLMPANTSEERYRLLDNRDKILRPKFKKQSDIATAKATIGTCPDMCPEKERYMRAFQNQLHPFEMKPSNDSANNNHVLDHYKVVKEYSRSSADQEEPLPHELRSSNVLTMTMDYMVCNIMDLHEGGHANAEEWYDFVWNRTRGIRKDITQQHLCDHSAVMLVEKCARFHIHCAERLCEEHMSTFDQKINDENLTNCLQTLKHLYADLETKNEYCFSEPEFRAYDVLLNLNEGDILRQVQLLGQRVRESPEVVEALGFYYALNNNNYVRFFKLLQRTTYLNACILQKYFTQARLKALLSIVKGYSPPNHSGQFPVTKLVSLLAFENEMHAEELFQHCGLQIENGNLILDKSTFKQPESSPPLRRSLQIIESKRRCSVGEVINHGPLPKNPHLYHVPYNSFDNQGFLRKDALDVVRLNEQLINEDSGTVLPGIQNYKTEERSFNINEVLEKISSTLINDVVATTVKRISSGLLQGYRFLNTTSLEIVVEIFADVCGCLTREIATRVLLEEKAIENEARKRREKEERERLEHVKKLKEQWTSEILEDVISNIVELYTYRIAKEELKKQLELERQRCLESSTLQLADEFWKIWTDEMLRSICSCIHLEATKFKKATLERISQKLDLWRATSFVSKWRNVIAKRKRARHTMETFPSSNLTSRKHDTFQKRVGSSKDYPISPLHIAACRNRLDRLFDMSLLNSDLRKEMGELKIDVLSVAKDFIPSNDCRHKSSPSTMNIRKRKHSLARSIYWKVATYFYGGQDRSDEWEIVAEWLRSKLPDSSSKTDIIIIDRHTDNFESASAAVCVKILNDRSLFSKSDLNLKGTQGFLLVFEVPTVNYNEIFWETLRKKLKSLLCNKPPYPPIPLAILAVGIISLESVATYLHLEDLLKTNALSDCYVSVLPGDLLEPNSTNVLLNSLQWLAKNSPPPPDLNIESMAHFLADMITTCFSSLICHYAKREDSNYLFNLPPDVIISAFNHAINHAATVASDDALMDISWPPTELANYTNALPDPQWNCQANLQKLKTLISSYRLPTFNANLMKLKEWSGLCDGIWNYINNFTDGSWASTVILASRIQKVLDRSYDLYESMDKVKVLPYEVFQWIDLVNVIVDFKLQDAAMLDIDVVYDSQKANSFTISQEWKAAALKHLIHIDVAAVPISPPTSSKRKLEIVQDEDGGRSQQQQQKRKVHNDPFRTPSEEEELQESCKSLLQHIKEEKRRWLEFDQLLTEVLEEGKLETN